jgi:hypothetical protein
MLPFVWEARFLIDREHRTGVYARPTVDAGFRVDVKLLRRCERHVVGSRSYAIDRADVDT